MQSYKFTDVIERTAQKKNLNSVLLKSMSDFIWKETKQELHRFSNLRIYLKGLVAWYYGKKRLITFKQKLVDKINAPNQEVADKQKVYFFEKMNLEQLEETNESMKKLLDLYEVYIEDKRTTKKKYREEMEEIAKIKMYEYNSKIQELENSK